MQTCRLIAVLLSCCVCSASCYPSRPLNERSTDLAWEAWLLIDDQNQHRQQPGADGGAPRRRITPKSVFIAPTFSPESLPACADGYGADVMGRCMKIVRIDPDRQYDFLIEKLKEKFGGSFDYDDGDEEEEEEEVVVGQATQGPFQLNIPLEIDQGDLREEQSEEESVALIVSPTKANPYVTKNKLDKRYTTLDDEEAQEMYLKRLAEATTTEAGTEEAPTTRSEADSSTTETDVTDVTSDASTTLSSTPTVPPEPQGQADDPSAAAPLEGPAPKAKAGIFNRRDRDRHNELFFLPPTLGGAGSEKPIVLRFSRKDLGAGFETSRHTEYYRAIPSDDFAYLFKFKHKRPDPI